MKDVIVLAIIEMLNKSKFGEDNMITIKSNQIHLATTINFFLVNHLFFYLQLEGYEIITMEKDFIKVLKKQETITF
ncbi:hypothetical protein EZS27_028666 [termite gut metagenome]|uniref:Uncharacterized protein n=1 Tax=termite gut metagenome TaxID=433724 RepID=A0A5J4QIQ6_9ZZZZ